MDFFFFTLAIVYSEMRKGGRDGDGRAGAGHERTWQHKSLIHVHRREGEDAKSSLKSTACLIKTLCSIVQIDFKYKQVLVCCTWIHCSNERECKVNVYMICWTDVVTQM